MKEYQEKNQKPTVVEEPIKPVQPETIKPSEPIKSDVKKKKVIKKVIRYVETDSDDDDEEIIVKKEKKKPKSTQNLLNQPKTLKSNPIPHRQSYSKTTKKSTENPKNNPKTLKIKKI